MKRILLLFAVFFTAFTFSVIAQRTVTGKVTDETGESLPGANVVVDGTTTGTTTDLDGKYSLSVPDGSSLKVSFIGYVTQVIEVGARSVIDLSLVPEQLEDVVITAMGVTRDKASLGYSQQTVGGEKLSIVKNDNFINSLSGKVAGVQVRQNNLMGGSTNITIRGSSSFSNNQALFVIDGVPVGNSTNNTSSQQNGGRGYDYGNPASDINPDDIESMSVLKGAAATALYGARAQNGVILITTKKGTKSKGVGISISSSLTIGNIDKSTFAEYQNEYGAGYGAYYGSTGYFNDEDVNGDGKDDLVVPTTEDGSYGGKFDPNKQVYHWDAFVPESDNYKKSRPWVAAKNTPVTFFETLTNLNNSIAFTGGNDKNQFRLSYANISQKGILPNSKLGKNTITFNGTSQINSKLTADALFLYSRQDVTGRYSTGYGDNLMSQFRQWWEVNVDVQEQREIFEKTQKNYSWNMADTRNPLKPIFWDNPYWTRYKNYSTDNRDRFLSKVGLNYAITDWLNWKSRASVDTYFETREDRRAQGSVPTSFGILGAEEESGYDRTDIGSTEYNFNSILAANKNLSENVSLSALIGFNLRKEKYSYMRNSTSGGLVVPGIFAISNSRFKIPFPFQYLREKEVYGYFTNVNLGYKGFLYLDGNFRTDVTSSLPVKNNTYSYYSVGLGLVFSELLDLDAMDFGKFRASYGTVGNDTRALRVGNTYARLNNFGTGVARYSVRSTRNNPDLKPEITTEYEFGLEASFFDNRLNFDVAYYNRRTKNQLIDITTSSASGYQKTFINAGTIENKGVELVLGGDIVRNKNFTFNSSVNFNLNRNKVINLNGENKNFVLASYQGGVTSNAAKGEPLGVFKGTGYEYLKGKKVIVKDKGLYYYKSKEDTIIGDPNPDFLLGINNTLTYKGIVLSFLVDMQFGGDVYSLDMHYGRGTGLYPETVGNNDKGNPKRSSIKDGGGIKLDGVLEDGKPFNDYVRADFYKGAYYWGNSSINPGIATVYDASYVKLRELSIGYSFPKSLISKVAQKVQLSLVGRNLWIIHKNVPFADPESGLGSGVAQGYLSGSYPTVRELGFKLDVTF